VLLALTTMAATARSSGFNAAVTSAAPDWPTRSDEAETVGAGRGGSIATRTGFGGSTRTDRFSREPLLSIEPVVSGSAWLTLRLLLLCGLPEPGAVVFGS
jgi:hypothetical protein